MTKCPICQIPLIPRQSPPSPKFLQCPSSYRGSQHTFEFLCYETDAVHHYKYILLGFAVTFWPPNPNYLDSVPHVVIHSIGNNEKLIYSGPPNRDFMDFPKITEYLKLLSVFS